MKLYITEQARHIGQLIMVAGFLVLSVVDIVWYYWYLDKPWP